MNGYITTNRFSRIVDIPAAFAQTELRRGKTIQVAQVPLSLGQTLQLKSLTVTLVRVLTPGQVPDLLNSSLGLCSVGLYFGPMLSSPLAYAKVTTAGAATVNPFSTKVFSSQGFYTVLVANNTSNLDLSVAVSGALKLYI
jgi:hypothetical protein